MAQAVPPPPARHRPEIDWGVEGERIVRALLAPTASDDRWAAKLLKDPELQVTVYELGYQLARAHQLGRDEAFAEAAAIVAG